MALNSNGQSFKLTIPKQAVGANLVYFDLFNASGSNAKLFVRSVLPVISGADAVTGILGVDLFLTFTTAVGTGGTAATYGGSSLTAATITPMNPSASAAMANITARLTPSGGATAGGVLSAGSVFTEETNSGAYGGSLHDLIARGAKEPVIVPAGFGVRVVQGSVASVGNIGFDITFDAVPE